MRTNIWDRSRVHLSSDWMERSPLREGIPTLGGLQFWADVLIRGDWRIQIHAQSHRHRLLDRWFVQRATGSFADCAGRLESLMGSTTGQISSRVAHGTVLVLHGLGRTRFSMETIASHLRHHGWNAHTVAYPSTQAPIEMHATFLAAIIRSVPGDGPIHLVGHSMGGLVARTYLESDPDPRVRRVVMIGTPNQGAEKAIFFERVGLIGLVGPAARQLVPGPAGIAHRLSSVFSSPVVEIGIIAGGGPLGKGYSFVLPADNDGVVTVASTLLPGAKDFLLLRAHHSFLPSILRVRTATERFLRTGCFRDDGKRQAISAETHPSCEESKVNG
ncbi:alpha/beta fold hydrolase [bacterium]|nr:alpha/beta fold hydrolase [bacterium]